MSARLKSERRTHLVLASILIVRAIVIHQVDEFQVVPDGAFEIVRVVSWCNLDGTSTEGHVNGDSVGDDRDPTPVERVNDEFSMQVLYHQQVFLLRLPVKLPCSAHHQGEWQQPYLQALFQDV
jgi:hypothetical protein